MAQSKPRCNICGKELNEYEEGLYGIHNCAGYGSKYDGDKIDFDFCTVCFDAWIDEFGSKCIIDPIVER